MQTVINKWNYLCWFLLAQCLFQQLSRRFDLRHQKTFPIFLLTHSCAPKSARRSVCPSARAQWNKEQRYQCARVQPIGALRFRWRDATRRLWSLLTAQEARRAQASEVKRKGNAPHATASSSFYCNRSEFPANSRGTRRLEQNEWLVSILLCFYYSTKTLCKFFAEHITQSF